MPTTSNLVPLGGRTTPFRAARLLTAWHDHFRDTRDCHMPELVMPWMDCPQFCLARMTGLTRVLHVVPIPPYTQDGGYEDRYALVDLRESGGGVHIRQPFPSYQLALLAAAALAASELIEEDFGAQQ
jgi:hypothetical protein